MEFSVCKADVGGKAPASFKTAPEAKGFINKMLDCFTEKMKTAAAMANAKPGCKAK